MLAFTSVCNVLRMNHQSKKAIIYNVTGCRLMVFILTRIEMKL